MSRLTEKDITYITSGANVIEIPNIIEGHKFTGQAIIKLGQLEDIEEWFSKKRFYGKASNEPNKILELEFDKLDFRPEEYLLLIHFKVLNSWASNIFYNILSYGKTWSLTKEELE